MTATARQPIATLDVPGIIRLVRAAAEQHNTRDDWAETLAIEAFQAGRAVYWTKALYHNQRALVLLDEANKHGLAAALNADDDGRHDSTRRYQHIDTLLPLTPRAESELEEARWMIAGGRQAAE